VPGAAWQKPCVETVRNCSLARRPKHKRRSFVTAKMWQSCNNTWCEPIRNLATGEKKGTGLTA
jgi:hypothetical protein